ncbi:MAG: sigma-54-dependent Fis family transcriptional regulator, partial [Planctomycetes bacterium]|nr:sigma-54-dependent Fis family transcriptional regulator [Planctomycetota bacterium]
TIFLDEIGTSSPGFQVRLLRVLQDRVVERVGDSQSIDVDVRVILATNVELEAAVRDGSFREDLYYRIQVVNLEMPPLRLRRGDIANLAALFLRRYAAETGKPVRGFTDAALRILLEAPWPGNIRQLENVIERAVVLSEHEAIRPEDLPATLHGPGTPPPADNLLAPDSHLLPLRDGLAGPERLLIERALAHFGGNRKQTAESLDINRSTLFNKMRKYDLL